MARWSIEDAVAMERRHVLAGEKMVSRQECLANELVGKGRDQLAQSANEVLVILRESLGRVDGFDQDEGAGQSEEGGEVSRRLLTA